MRQIDRRPRTAQMATELVAVHTLRQIMPSRSPKKTLSCRLCRFDGIALSQASSGTSSNISSMASSVVSLTDEPSDSLGDARERRRFYTHGVWRGVRWLIALRANPRLRLSNEEIIRLCHALRFWTHKPLVERRLNQVEREAPWLHHQSGFLW